MNVRLLILRQIAVAAMTAALLVVCTRNATAQAEVQPIAGPAGGGVLMSLPSERAARVRTLMVRVKLTNGQLEERLQQYREALEEQYRGYRLDEALCRRLHLSVRQTQDQLLELHHRFQIELRALLTPAEFDTLQKEFARSKVKKLDHLRGQKKPEFLRSLQKPGADSKE